MARTFGQSTTDSLIRTASGLPDSTTISLWLKPSGWSSSGTHYVLSGVGTNVKLFHQASSLLFMAQGGEFRSLPIAAVTNDVWHHIIVTYYNNAAGAIFLYMDGSGSSAACGFASVPLTGWCLGDLGASGNSSSAVIAEYGRWNRILSYPEILALYRGHAPSVLKNGLVDYLPIWGNNSLEVSDTDPGSWTVTGTAKAQHLPQIYPAPNSGTVAIPPLTGWKSLGSIGSAQSKVGNQTSIAFATTAELPVGRLALVGVAIDNQAGGASGDDQAHITAVGLSDSAGNTWFRLGGNMFTAAAAAQSGCNISLWASLLTIAIPLDATISATLVGSAANDASAVVGHQFGLPTGASFRLEGRGLSTGTNTTIPTATISNLTSQEYLFIDGVALEGPDGDTFTYDPDYTRMPSDIGTTGGSATTNITLRAESRIATLTTDTANGSVNNSRDIARVFVALKKILATDTTGLFGPGVVPRLLDSGSATAVTVANRFRVSVACSVSAIRFYKGSANNSGTHVVGLWQYGTSTALASATVSGESGTAWQQQALATPIALTPGTDYLVGYLAPAGHTTTDVALLASGNVGNPLVWMPYAGSGGLQSGFTLNSGTLTYPVTGTATTTGYGVDVVLVRQPSGVSARGAFDVVGQDAILSLPPRTLAADAGAFAFTGIDSAGSYGYVATADAGPLALAGQDAALRQTYVTDTGVYALEGQSATLSPAFGVSVDAGSFASAGQDAVLLRPLTLVAESGVFDLAGQDAAVLGQYSLVADSGALALSGQEAEFAVTSVPPAEPGAFALAGESAEFLVSYILVSDAVAFDFVGEDAVLTVDTAGPEDPTSVPDEYVPNEDLTWVQASSYIWALHPANPLAADKGGLALEEVGSTGAPVAIEPDNVLEFQGGTSIYYQTTGSFIFGDDPPTEGNQTPPAVGGFSFWVKFFGDDPSTSYYSYMTGQAPSGAPFIMSYFGDLYAAVNGISYVAGQPVVNTWTHIAFTNDATYRRLYVNGVKLDEQAEDSTAQTNAPWEIGSLPSREAGGATLLGQMRLVAVINGEIWTDAEILEMYERPYAYYGAEAPSLGIDAESGDFDVAGQAADLRGTYRLSTITGAFDLEGQPAVFLLTYILTIDAGAYAFEGQPAILVGLLQSGGGAYSLTGQDVGVRTTRLLLTDTGAFALSGQTAALQLGHSLLSDVGTFALAGQPALSLRTYILGMGAGAYAFEGQPAILVGLLQSGGGLYALNGVDVAFRATRILQSDTGALALAGQTATTLYGRAIVSDVGAYGLAGQIALFRQDRRVQTELGAFVLSGQLAQMFSGQRMISDAGAYALAGQPAILTPLRGMQADKGTLLLSGQPALLLATRGLISDAGLYSYAGQVAALQFVRRVSGDAGAYALDGQAIAVALTRALQTETGLYLYAGQAAGLLYLKPAVGSGRIFYVAEDERIVLVSADSRIYYVLPDPDIKEIP